MPLERGAMPGPVPVAPRGDLASGSTARVVARAPGPVVFLVVGLAYLALSQLVMWVNAPTNGSAGLWPGAGLTLAALMLLAPRKWGWVLGAVAVAELGGDLAVGLPLGASLGWTAANCIEPLVGAGLWLRFGRPPGALTPVRNLLVFFAVAVLAAPFVGSLIGTTAAVLGAGGSFATVWPRYFVGDALGVLVVAPALLAIRMRPARRSWWETGALLVTTAATTAAVFGHWHSSWTITMPYLLLPVLGWAALRYGVRGTAWLAFAITLVANWSTATGGGPFAGAGGPDDRAVALLQMYLAIAVSFALLLAALASDLRDRDVLEKALRHRAAHDALTGLATRERLGTTLESALARRARLGSQLGLLVCDVDHFKVVNDRVGHAGGDRLLVEIARRLQDAVRPGDMVARISGDEFVVLLQDVDGHGLEAVAQRVIEAVAVPVAIGPHREVTPSLSVGAALADVGDSAESVFQAADSALYLAKKQGRGRVVHVDEGLRGQVHEQSRIENELASGLAESQFHPVFEPGVDLSTGLVTGFEALARWHHPTRGLLLPERFIPAVEATGMADNLLARMLEQSLRAQNVWAEHLGHRPPVAVNISTLQLADSRVIERLVQDTLDRTGAPVDRLWLDITENAPLDDSSVRTLRALRDMGLHLALDGFGRSGSSLGTLGCCTWDLIKIDRTFAGDLRGRRAGGGDLFRATIAMARTLDIPTIAQGIETAAQLEQVRHLGCDFAQGRFFGPPATADEVHQLLDSDGHWLGEPSVPEQEGRARATPARPGLSQE